MKKTARVYGFTSVLGPQKLISRAQDQICRASPGSLPRDLALECSQKLITKQKLDPSSIDLILYSSSWPDTVNIGFGPFVQKSISAHKASILQVDCACASFSAMLEVAQQLIASGYHKRILVLGISHMISRLKDAQSQEQGQNLGEGASAFLVEEGPSNFGVNLPVLNNLKLEHYYPKRPEDHDWHGQGKSFRFGSKNKVGQAFLEQAPELWQKLSANENKNEFDFLLCNKPSKAFRHALADKLGLKDEKIFSSFERVGDLAQATIAHDLAEIFEQKKKAKLAFMDFSLDNQSIGAGFINLA